MIEPCPCKDCSERFTACSGKCPKDERGEFGYKAWKAQHHAQQKHLEDNKYRWQAPWTADRERDAPDRMSNSEPFTRQEVLNE